MEQEFKIASLAFAHGELIPQKYTCDGDDVSPPLEISNIPENTVSLALIVEDPDAPNGVFYHWLVWNIPPSPTIGQAINPGISGTNDFGKTGYGGPCPPSGTHRYYFKLYALDAELDIAPGAGKDELANAIEGHILATAELMGRYQKADKA